METISNFEKAKKIILAKEFPNGVVIREIENIFPDRVEQQIKIEARVLKSKEMDIMEFREALYDDLSEQIDSAYATDFINDHFTVMYGPLAQGEKFTSLELQDRENNKVVLKHESGKVMMLDFWATWCQFCQEPFEKYVKLSSNISPDIQIVGISCDEDFGKWNAHIDAKNWGSIPHYNKAGLLKVLGIKSIPDIAIIDKEGKVAYQGHPNHIKIDSLTSLSQGNGIVYDSNSNDNWIELSLTKKKEFVKELENHFKGNNVVNATFYVNTKNTFLKNKKISKTVIIFKGQLTAYEDEIVRKADLKNLEAVYNTTVVSLFDEDF